MKSKKGKIISNLKWLTASILPCFPRWRERYRRRASIRGESTVRGPRNRPKSKAPIHTLPDCCPWSTGANCRIPDPPTRCLWSSASCSACACRTAAWKPSRWIARDTKPVVVCKDTNKTNKQKERIVNVIPASIDPNSVKPKEICRPSSIPWRWIDR